METKNEDLIELINQKFTKIQSDNNKESLNHIANFWEQYNKSPVISSIEQLLRVVESLKNDIDKTGEENKEDFSELSIALDEKLEKFIQKITSLPMNQPVTQLDNKVLDKITKRFYKSIYVIIGLTILFSISLWLNFHWGTKLSSYKYNDIKYRKIRLDNMTLPFIMTLDSLDSVGFKKLKKEVMIRERENERLSQEQSKLQRLEEKTLEQKEKVKKMKRKKG